MTAKDLPTINAILNSISALLLLAGFIQIKIKRNTAAHKKVMLFALLSSSLFLVSYLIYHSLIGSVPYARFDWTRPVYFAILIPHVILAGLMVPAIFFAVYFALKGKFTSHKKIVKWLWPVWIFVSVSGIIVYVMLYQI